MHFTKITALLFLTSAAGVLAAPTSTINRRASARSFAELSIRYLHQLIFHYCHEAMTKGLC